jgi:hypothetical protein
MYAKELILKEGEPKYESIYKEDSDVLGCFGRREEQD